MTETPQEPVSLAYLSQQFDRHLTDLVLVEGFKQESIPKILVHLCYQSPHRQMLLCLQQEM